MTDVLTADAFDTVFDSGEDMGDLLEWESAFHDNIGEGLSNGLTQASLPHSTLDTTKQMTSERDRSRKGLLIDVTGQAVAPV